MVERNPHFSKLHGGYLFPRIEACRQDLLRRKPEARIINLGIGNTTQPLPSTLVESLVEQSRALGEAKTYEGYGPPFGKEALRQAIAEQIYGGRVDPSDVFISDGSKCDVGRLQLLFGSKAQLAVQDPSYPAYVATSVLVGQTGTYIPSSQGYQGISYLPCTAENDFFPDLSLLPEGSVFFLCSPNNPTGAVYDRKQLKAVIDIARQKRCIIIYDTAYAAFIQGEEFPRSIFEIEGAEEVSIETGSFSKVAGFTGVRLGWTVVPKALCYNDACSVQEDWKQIISSFFNAPSVISQAGGLAILTPEGHKACEQLIHYYLSNALRLRSTCQTLGFEVYGGEHAPYVWVRLPGQDSWSAFQHLLDQAHLVTTPGVGFGGSGEGYLRLSGFASQKETEEACTRLQTLWSERSIV